MTAYEFTRFDVDFLNNLKAYKYNISDVSSKITSNNPDIRTEQPYEDAKSTFIELTMSCETHEAVSWMKSWILQSIGYGIQTKNRDWMHKFLAAEDILHSLGGTM